MVLPLTIKNGRFSDYRKMERIYYEKHELKNFGNGIDTVFGINT